MKISYVIAFVSDLEKARKFYTEKLGLSVTEEIPDEQSLTFNIENVKFGVHVPSEKNRHNIGKSTGILFYVDDVKKAHGELSARGVTFIKAPDTDAGPDRKDLAVFVDDDKNEYGLTNE